MKSNNKDVFSYAHINKENKDIFSFIFKGWLMWSMFIIWIFSAIGSLALLVAIIYFLIKVAGTF